MSEQSDRRARDQGTLSTAAAVALKGGQQSLLTFQGRWRPYCDTPRPVYRAIKPGTPGKRSIEVSIETPCRRCEKCLRFRRLAWRERALAELADARAHGRRTWMVTLTFSPHHLAGVLIQAKSPLEADIEASAYSHVQNYFKRLRKAGHKFRYLAVYERGEATGRSHYHLLLHELGPRPVPKDELERWWRSHVHARLVSQEDGAASYATKYLTKGFAARARASARYGNPRGQGAPAREARATPPRRTTSDDTTKRAERTNPEGGSGGDTSPPSISVEEVVT